MVGRTLKILLIGLSAQLLAACGESAMDSAVRAMASDEHIALFDSVIETLQTDDSEALQALLGEGFEDGFAQQAAAYFPNETPDAAPFLAFRFHTSANLDGRTRTLEFTRIYKYETGDYRVETVFFSQGESPLKLTRLSIRPILEEGLDHPGAAPSGPAPAIAPI
jgi:hypothetical protein